MPGSAPFTTSPLRALLIQPDPETRYQVCTQLDQLGFAVDECACPSEARAAYRRQPLVIIGAEPDDPTSLEMFLAWLHAQGAGDGSRPYILILGNQPLSFPQDYPPVLWNEIVPLPLDADDFLRRIESISTHLSSAPPPSSFYPENQESLPPRINPSGFQELIDRAPRAMAVCDRDLRYLAVNRRWKSAFGLEDRNLIGQRHSDLFPYLGRHWGGACQEVLHGQPGECPRDLWVQLNNQIHWVGWHLEPWASKRDAIGGFTITCDLLENAATDPAPRSAIPASRPIPPAVESHLAQLIDFLPFGIILLDADGRTVFANQEHASLLGLDLRSHPSLDDWLRSACPRPTQDPDELVLSWRHLVSQEETTRIFALRASDHRIRQIRFQPRRTGDGGLLLTLSDVTGLTEPQNRLAELEVVFHSLFTHAQAGLALEDSSGQIIHANLSFAALTQQSPEQLRDQNVIALIQPEDRPAVRARLAEIRSFPSASGPSLDVRLLPSSPDPFLPTGSQGNFVRLTLCGIPDERGRLLHFAYLFTDIAIERLKTGPSSSPLPTDPALLASLQRHALAFELAQDAILVTGPTGRILDANPAATLLFGYSRSAILGKSFSTLFAPDDAVHFHQTVAAAFGGEGRWTGAQSFLRKDGRTGYCQVHYAASQPPGSSSPFIIGFHKEIPSPGEQVSSPSL